MVVLVIGFWGCGKGGNGIGVLEKKVWCQLYYAAGNSNKQKVTKYRIKFPYANFKIGKTEDVSILN